MTTKYPNIGDKFGMLEVVSPSIYRTKEHKIAYMCQCECGSQRAYRATALRSGLIKSCGCKRQKNFYKSWAEYYKAHPSIKTRRLKGTYQSWRAIKARCLNHNNTGYKYYGGRGITICERWAESFQNFLDDMGIRPDGLSIGRINNDGNYEPGNCRWETNKEQANNTSRTIRIDGESLQYRLERLGVSEEKMSMVKYRILKGWTEEDAINTPKFFPNNDIKIGDRFGMFVIVSDIADYIIYKNRSKPNGIKKHRALLCRCDCGKESLVVVEKLRNGNRVSCGCRRNMHPVQNNYCTQS